MIVRERKLQLCCVKSYEFQIEYRSSQELLEANL